MSSFSDRDVLRQLTESRSSSTLTQTQLKTICFAQLNVRARDFWFDQSEKTILVFCLIVFLIYCKFFCLSCPMIKEISLKDDYFREELRAEQDAIVQYKKQFDQFVDEFQLRSNRSNFSCRQCSSLLSLTNSEQIFRILKNNQHIKDQYDHELFPFQWLFILLCLFNNFLIVFIFEKAYHLYFLSNIFLLVCLAIYAELFIEDRPSVFYILIVAVLILLFTVYLLWKIFNMLSSIVHYHRMKKTLENIQ